MATTPILSLPVAIGVDNTCWVPVASTATNQTERVNVVTLSGLQGNLDQITDVQGSVLYRGALQWDGLGPGTAGYVLSTQGPGQNPSWVPNTAGSVTSVGLDLPTSVFSVSGSPVTSSGILEGSFVSQHANLVFSGPGNGADAIPTFRTLVNADISGGGVALTKVDDTNVTLTLGGSASSSLVNPASITAGWSGQLSVPRGGTGLSSLTSHNLLIGNGASSPTLLAPGSTGQVLASNGVSADPSWQSAPSAFGQALTRVNDTNVTLTLGGTPNTAVLSATSITVGWTGVLGLARGGTNADLSTTGGTSQVLRQSSTGASITVSQLSASDIANGQALTKTDDTNVTLTFGGTPGSALLAATSIAAGWAGTLAVSRGGLGVGTLTTHGVLLGQGTSSVTATTVGATGSVLAGNTSADPTFQTIATVLDNLGSTQGQLLYRGASAWTVLNPGTSGQLLQSGGPSANPSWITAGGTGTVTSVDVSGGTTGLTTSGGPVIGSGTITLAGTLIPANGGTGITSLGAGVAAWFGTPSSANLAAAVTDETGSGALVFATSPTLSAPVLGTPASGTLTNCTGLPNASVVGLGTAALKSTGTSGNNVPLLDGANSWSDVQSFIGQQPIVCTYVDGGATEGPRINLVRDSSSPAASDLIGLFAFQGRDSSANIQTYGKMGGIISSPTAGSISGLYNFALNISGGFQNVMQLSSGVVVGSPTGGFKGLGTLNAQSGVYNNNTALTCMALANEFHDSRTIDVDKWDAMVPDLVIPERVDVNPVMETVSVSKAVLADTSYGKVVSIATVEDTRQAFDLIPIYDDKGNGLDAIAQPVFETIVTPEQTIKRVHGTARLFKDMCDAGFDPRDPEQFFAKMRADEALPGMPTKADWQHNEVESGELFCRHWLATEMLAIVSNVMWNKIKDLDARISVLESAKN